MLIYQKSFREVEELARGAIGKERQEGEGGGRGGKGKKKVTSHNVANYRWNFVVVCWVVLDGQLYIFVYSN